jgi:glycosyltransferase involved in cell wall biosynthesis
MGGAEKVVQQIAEAMVHDFNYQCTIITQHGISRVMHNGVQILPTGSLPENVFVDALLKEKPDHILIYGDWFFRFPTILQHIDKLKCKITLIPVGFNRLRSQHNANKILKNIFHEKHEKFSIIVHSDYYIDAKFCQTNNYPYKIIANGINLREFENTKNAFRDKYKINSEKILLCVSNFFPGKGQEFLLPIVKNLTNNRSDFTLVFVSTTLSFMLGNKRREEINRTATAQNLPILFLNDIPREDVIQSYFACDAFVFPSQQEVSPLVLLESMAASKPWISMNVGNAEDLHGGFCFKSAINNDNMLVFDNEIKNKFTDTINMLLDNPSLCKTMGEVGNRQIIEKYNWDKIKYKYKEEFDANTISRNDRI